MKRTRARMRGFTFLEMAVVLFTTGLLFAAVPGLMHQAGDVLASQPGATPAEQGRLALSGFIQRHYRLPCPAATATSGTEDCNLRAGYVPYLALGLAKPLTNRTGGDFRYGVQSGLTRALDRYTPTYQDNADYWDAATDLRSQQINLLDFCGALRTAAQAGPDSSNVQLRTPAAGAVNVAWVLADPGAADADRDGRLFDHGNGANAAPLLFESGGRAQSADYDDVVTAAGLHQLFGQLRCPALLAAVSAAAREADFANANWRATAFLYDFRVFEHDVRRKKKEMADNALLIARFDISMAASMSVLDIGIGVASSAGAVEIGLSVINASAAITMSALGLKDALKGVDDAAEEVSEGAQRESDAQAALAEAATFRAQRRAALLLLDRRGGFQ